MRAAPQVTPVEDTAEPRHFPGHGKGTEMPSPGAGLGTLGQVPVTAIPPPSPSAAKNAGNEPGAKLLLLPRPTRQDFKIAPCPARLRPEPRVPAGTTHAGRAGKGQERTGRDRKGQKGTERALLLQQTGRSAPSGSHSQAWARPQHGGGCVAPAVLALLARCPGWAWNGQTPMSPCAVPRGNSRARGCSLALSRGDR